MTVSIPASEVRELTAEEFDPLKDALLGYLRGLSSSARELVDKNFHVSRGCVVPAYAYALLCLTETRDPIPTPITKPFTPDMEKKLGGSLELDRGGLTSVDIWSFPSEERTDFSAYSDAYLVPGTIVAKDCGECLQRGSLGCKTCMGKGVESCPVCLGAGRQPCVFCKGAEKVSCLRCGGEGKLASGEVGGRAARCDACNGSGKFPCIHCQGGKVTCPQCQGGGKASCTKCHGQGKVTCAGCGGNKKILTGQAFRSTFTPHLWKSTAFVEGGNKEALEIALANRSEVCSLPLSGKDSFEAQIKEVDLPFQLKNALFDLAARERAQVNPKMRAVKRRLEWVEGSAVRITGYCAGQEFAYWMVPGDPRVVAEIDPISNFGRTAAVSAEEARAAGDWAKALTLARESLTFSPDQTIARYIVSEFRRNVVRETLSMGFLGGLLSALGHAAWVFLFLRGINKMGALGQMAGFQMILGPLAAAVLIPVALRIPRVRPRRTWVGIVLTMVFVVATIVLRWGSDWNPVRAADQAAFDQELDGHFRYGTAKVYFEPDLRFLQGLQRKYQNTDVDITRARQALSAQLILRDNLQKTQEEFDARVSSIISGVGTDMEKKARLEKIIGDYRVSGVDPKSAEVAMAGLRLVEPKRALRGAARRMPDPVSRIKIYPSGGHRSNTASPRPVVKKPIAPVVKKPISKPASSAAKKPTLAGKKKAWWE